VCQLRGIMADSRCPVLPALLKRLDILALRANDEIETTSIAATYAWSALK